MFSFRLRTRLASIVVFARECFRSPRSMGTICPSGRALARIMASKVTPGNGLVVELGAGTGVVTSALIQRGVSPQRLLVIERSEALVDLLRRRFPGVTVIHGDAAELSRYIPASRQVDCIVSSLPFVSLPEHCREEIIREIKQLLNDGVMLQYTYSWGKESCLSKAGLTCVGSTRVWQNVPPAKVMEFRSPQ